MREGREVLHQACFFNGGWVGYPDFLDPRRRAVGPRRLVLRGARREARPPRQARPHLPAALLHRRARAPAGPPSRPHAPDARRRRASRLPARGLRGLRRGRAAAVRRPPRGPRGPGRRPGVPVPGAGLRVLPLVARLRRAPPGGRPPLARREPAPGAGPQARGRGHPHRRRSSPRCPRTPSCRGSPQRRSPRCARRPPCRSAAAGSTARSSSCSSPRTTAASAGCPSRRPATCTSTSRATRTGATTVSSTSSGPVRGGRRMDATGRCGRRPAPRRSTRSRRGWTGSRARLEAFPDLHVFHYNAYETVALKKLVARHATREHELDELLRRKVFVDLYGITRQAVRAGIGGLRPQGARARLRLRARRRAARRDRLDAALAGLPGRRRTGAPRRHRRLQRGRLPQHPRRSTTGCWRGARRPRRSSASQLGHAAARGAPAAESQGRRAAGAHSTRCASGCSPGCPTTSPRTTERQRALRTTFDLLGYHRREAKPALLGALRPPRAHPRAAARRGRRGDRRPRGARRASRSYRRSWQWTLSFPAQEYKLGPGDVDEPLAERGASIVSRSTRRRAPSSCARGKKAARTRRWRSAPGWPLTDGRPGRRALPLRRPRRRRRGSSRAAARRGRRPAAAPPAAPRSRAPRPWPTSRSTSSACGRRSAASTAASWSSRARPAPARRGPARGSRSTCSSAACASASTATSHKAINNLLAAIDEAADEAGVAFRGWKKGSDAEDSDYDSDRVVVRQQAARRRTTGRSLLRRRHRLALGARGRARQRRRAVHRRGRPGVARRRDRGLAGAPRSVVLLGDPQQLAHVSQGTHPLGSGASVLEHLLGEARHRPGRPRRLPRHLLAHAPRGLRLRVADDVRRPPDARIDGCDRAARRLARPAAAAGCG